MQINTLLQHLDRPTPYKGRNDDYFSFCPCHADGVKNNRRSLRVQEKDGKILFYCFAGCRTEDITKALGLSMSDLFTEDRPKSAGRQIISTYGYTDESGSLVYQVIKYYPKDFRQRRPDGQGGWLWNMKDIQPVPYHLPELLKAMAAGENVFITEGEKDADNLAKIGIVATCNSGGAGKWSECHSKYFTAGAQVIVLPDQDRPGRDHAAKVAAQLTGRGCIVKLVNLPGLPDKGDISDWLKAGHGTDELLALVETAACWVKPEQVAADLKPEPWPEPEKLEKDLPPVEILPVKYIPEPFQEWLKDIAFRMQCPFDFVAAAAIVMASSIIGAGCGIRPKQRDDWTVIPNLWGVLVARPGMYKTPALHEALKPVQRLEVDAKEEHQKGIKLHNAKTESHKAQKSAIKSQMEQAAKKGLDLEGFENKYADLEEPDIPARRRFQSNDATVEKISELLNENPRGIMVFRDELTGQLVSWDKAGHESDRQFFLEAWNGKGSFTTDRIGRGTIDTENLCISLLGSIQPEKLLAYLKQTVSELKNDGLIQRMQVMVYPDEMKNIQFIDEYANKDAKNRAFIILKKLAYADFRTFGAVVDQGEKIPYFHFTDEAQEIFNQWYLELKTGKIAAEERTIIVEHLTKYASLMPSLALIFHLVDVADGRSSGQVSKDATLKAAAWCEYLEGHARRVYGMLADISERAAASLGDKIIKGLLGDLFTVRDVYRKHWNLLDTKEDAQAACNELTEAGWLRAKVEKTDGRSREVFYVNPKVKGEQNE